MQPFAAVYFDCDSTLATIEGIDDILRHADEAARREVLELTRRAMEGTLPLAEVYESRLARLAPPRDVLEEVGEHYCRSLVPDAAEVVAALQHLGKHVGIISGGLELPVRRLAAHLGVPEDNVHAVPVLFGPDGSYRDFDRSSPLWRNGGKVDVLEGLPAGHRPVLYVGDGVTDLEAAPVVDRFVGYGGVAVREKVRAAAEHWFETRSLAPLLAFATTEAERAELARHPRFGGLVERAHETSP